MNKPKVQRVSEKKCCDKCTGYFDHRVGSHSDDWGGDSDLPCYCNEDNCRKIDCECHNPTTPQSIIETKKQIEAIANVIYNMGKQGSDIKHAYATADENINILLDQIAHAVIESVRMEKIKLIGKNGFYGTEKDVDAMVSLEVGYNKAISELNTKLSLLEQQLK